MSKKIIYKYNTPKINLEILLNFMILLKWI